MVIADPVAQPFERFLDWRAFALRLHSDDVAPYPHWAWASLCAWLEDRLAGALRIMREIAKIAGKKG